MDHAARGAHCQRNFPTPARPGNRGQRAVAASCGAQECVDALFLLALDRGRAVLCGMSRDSSALLAPPAGRYLESPFRYRRFKSREVRIGDVRIGGDNPIVLQSMTISDTLNTEAVVAEAIQLWEAGSELVRITAPGPKDAENLKNIKAELKRRGFHFPVVADIHFAPKAALIAAEYVEKVRINPGNFVDRKRFAVREYNDSEYAEELERVREIFIPLVKRCRELGRAMRIGANHGSLSDRIMNRFGDTALGMVESALEFIKIAEEFDFHDIVVSMKASNPQVMVQAYRLLVERFYVEGMAYPLHLGVTEAGNGQDGRIKSAIGIGSLLDDGLGDTIRVSLTEDAIYELPAARRIADRYNQLHARGGAGSARARDRVQPASEPQLETRYLRAVNPYVFERFLSEAARGGSFYIGSKHQHRAFVTLTDSGASSLSLDALLAEARALAADGADAFVVPARAFAGVPERAWPADAPPLFLEFGSAAAAPDPAEIAIDSIAGAALELSLADDAQLAADLAALRGRLSVLFEDSRMTLIQLRVRDLSVAASERARRMFQDTPALCGQNVVFSIALDPATDAEIYLSPTKALRWLAALFLDLAAEGKRELPPLLLRGRYASLDDAVFDASLEMGPLFLDGLGDGLWIETAAPASGAALLKLELDLLQAVRLRLSKTEFISCPSCGRTLFDLQTTTARIQASTGHLKGVKIAVMGCIVNGPGEMADADFGYVGAGPGKIHLYRGKEIVKSNIPSEIADAELIELIRAHGMWKEPDER